MTKLYDRPEICRHCFYPQPGRQLDRSDLGEPVVLALADGTRIGGFWCHPSPDAPTLLYLHGNGERIADQLETWPSWAQRAGANIFFVDYPGYATSAGSPTLSGCCQAAQVALDFLLARDGDQVPAIIVVGRSIGSLFALDVVARNPGPRLSGLALESGIADLCQRLAVWVPHHQLAIDRPALEAAVAADFDQRAKLGRVEVPVLVLHTERDAIVPIWHGEQFAAWAGSHLLRFVRFEAGDHNTIQLFNEGTYVAALADLVNAARGRASGCAARR
ncbi:MAG: hypothetical protein JXR83_12940 [Deltaproteobacteria bacterium]|nr:hypothetical protein [Deltaproteobacteria bacterium]